VEKGATRYRRRLLFLAASVALVAVFGLRAPPPGGVCDMPFTVLHSEAGTCVSMRQLMIRGELDLVRAAVAPLGGSGGVAVAPRAPGLRVVQRPQLRRVVSIHRVRDADPPAR
jgi:hypothetical protein